MLTTEKKTKKTTLKTTVTKKNTPRNSWVGKIIKDKKTVMVEVNSISDLLARCVAFSK